MVKNKDIKRCSLCDRPITKVLEGELNDLCVYCGLKVRHAINKYDRDAVKAAKEYERLKGRIEDQK